MMDFSAIDPLLADLKNPEAAVRDRATQELWRIWFYQKGAYGLELLERSQLLMETGQVREAEAVLNEIIADQPDFAEAWNRRAVFYYVQGQYRQALADCQQVVALMPAHFGALHGMGLCHAALGEYTAAIQAFRRALEVQPYALVNQKLILECTAKLS
jgi:tetratricopeptide (TPR) repeat protein